MADASKRAAAGAHGGVTASSKRAAASTRRAERDLKDPVVQAQIQFPPEFKYTLRLADGDRAILIPTKFTLAENRRVLDDLEQWAKLVTYTLMELDPNGSGVTIDIAWISAHPQMFDVALCGGIVREKARGIITKLAKFAEPTHPDERPTFLQITDGLDSIDVAAISIFLLNRYNEELAARRNRPPKA
jgi:hypothetical protein